MGSQVPPSTPMPWSSTPMLGTLIDKPFDNAAWIFEPKYDGLRVLGALMATTWTCLAAPILI